MAISNKQIGWSQESNLLWQLAKQVDNLTKITANVNVTALPYKLISEASTNAKLIKASAGVITSITAINLSEDSVSYLKLYDKASAPTVGTDIPVLTFPIPTNSLGAGLTIAIPGGTSFKIGIALAITSGVADTNTDAISAEEVIVNVTYK